MTADDEKVHGPVPITHLAHRYYLYDLPSISYLRKHHNILGCFIGTLPQHSQQNVFLGLPLELMAEEARLLVEQGVAFIVDDMDVHAKQLRRMEKAERDKYARGLQKHGAELAKKDVQRREENTRNALAKMSEEQRAKVLAKRQLSSKDDAGHAGENENESLFGPASPSPSISSSTATGTNPSIVPKCITPTTSHPPLPLPTPPASPTSSHATPKHLPPTPNPASYALYRHLHNHGYFLSPGLRFGCQFCVYPGDPLRFHSHFLSRGYAWDEEIRLMDLVGGGRLGTGVKKGFLVGGPVKKESNEGSYGQTEEKTKLGKGVDVRVFCVEWAGM